MGQVIAVIGDQQAEAAYLGCLLAGVREEVLDLEDFSSPQHQAVFLTILALASRGEPVDPVTVVGEMRRCGLEKALTCDRSAGVFLADLLAAPPSLGSVGHYRRILIEHRVRRVAYSLGMRLQQIAEQSSTDELDGLLREAFQDVRVQCRRLEPALSAVA